MTQPPLFPLPPEISKPDAQDRLQAMVDALYPNDSLLVERRRDGWYLCGASRWFGDDGRDWIGQNEAEAVQYLRGLR